MKQKGIVVKTCVNIKRYIGTQIARWMIPKARWRAKLNKMHITPAVRRKSADKNLRTYYAY